MDDMADDTDSQQADATKPCAEPSSFSLGGTSAQAHTGSSVSDDEMPPGDHALEVAARRGVGPLSPAGRDVWHGRTRPCASCGQLVDRDDQKCGQCGQDLSGPMLDKMRAAAGPWYVLEHVRPFPGVRFERLVRQILRGVLTETSIVRGPTTNHQWRFAVETPGLAKYFGRCWDCHGEVRVTDEFCTDCLTQLDQLEPIPPLPRSFNLTSPLVGGEPNQVTSPLVGGEPNKVASPLVGSAVDSPPAHSPPTRGDATYAAPVPGSSQELRELSEVVEKAEMREAGHSVDDTPRIAGVRATWVVFGLLVVFIVALVAIVQERQGAEPPTEEATPLYSIPQTPALQPPADPAKPPKPRAKG